MKPHEDSCTARLNLARPRHYKHQSLHGTYKITVHVFLCQNKCQSHASRRAEGPGERTGSIVVVVQQLGPLLVLLSLRTHKKSFQSTSAASSGTMRAFPVQFDLDRPTLPGLLVRQAACNLTVRSGKRTHRRLSSFGVLATYVCMLD